LPRHVPQRGGVVAGESIGLGHLEQENTTDKTGDDAYSDRNGVCPQRGLLSEKEGEHDVRQNGGDRVHHGDIDEISALIAAGLVSASGGEQAEHRVVADHRHAAGNMEAGRSEYEHEDRQPCLSPRGKQGGKQNGKKCYVADDPTPAEYLYDRGMPHHALAEWQHEEGDINEGVQ